MFAVWSDLGNKILVTTPPYIERFEEFKRNEGRYTMPDELVVPVSAVEKFLTQELAREGKEKYEKGRQEGAEEKMRECLGIVDGMHDFGDFVMVESERYVKVADLKDRLIKK